MPARGNPRRRHDVARLPSRQVLDGYAAIPRYSKDCPNPFPVDDRGPRSAAEPIAGETARAMGPGIELPHRKPAAKNAPDHCDIPPTNCSLRPFRRNLSPSSTSVPTLWKQIQLVSVLGRFELRVVRVKQLIEKGVLEHGEAQDL